MPLSLRRRVAPLVGAAFLAWPAFAASLTAQPFTFSLLSNDLPAVYAGAVAWADIDNDGDLDAFVAGRTRDGLEAAVYRNDSPRGRHAAPAFARVAALDPVAYPAAAWGDYDRDGDLDLVVSGSATGGVPYAPTTRLYRNDGGAFTRVEAGLEGLHSGSAGWGDVDNDGDLDLLITGTAAADLPYVPATHLYRNEGGTFTRAEAGLPNVVFGDAAWGDYDGDGDLDLALVGYGGTRGFVGDVFRNDGGHFSAAGAGLPGLAFSSVDWGDYDGDGDLDLTLSGGRSSAFLLDGEAHVYRNEGGTTFQQADLGLEGVLAGKTGWGDYDGDGDLDLLVIGAFRPLGRYAARVYENRGATAFRERVLLVGAVFAEAAWGDYDSDGDLDLLTTGLAQPTVPSGSGRPAPRAPVTNLYRNDRVPLDETPAPPAALRAVVEGAEVALVWAPPADERPASKGLTYALRVGTAPGAADVLAAAADPATGDRRLTTPGEAATAAWTLRGLAPGTYYWAVQSVSAAFAGSPFVEGGAFTVGTATDAEAAVPAAFAVTSAYPNPFAEAVHVTYALPTPSPVTFRVFNVLGETVRTVRLDAPAGTHHLTWDGLDAAGRPAVSGLYVYELRTAHGAQSGRLVRVR